MENENEKGTVREMSTTTEPDGKNTTKEFNNTAVNREWNDCFKLQEIEWRQTTWLTASITAGVIDT